MAYDHNDSNINIVESGRNFVASAHAVFRRRAPLLSVPPTRRREEENSLDPDKAKYVTCRACELPIFSTPIISKKPRHNDQGRSYALPHVGSSLPRSATGNDDDIIHDVCDNLPKKLTNHVLHLGGELDLVQIDENAIGNISCSNCKALINGRWLYGCPDIACSFKLDVLCALTTRIKILHRSHEHRLMAIRGGSSNSFICRVCGTQHAPHADAANHQYRLSAYMCNDCGFWIHPDCASLPNIIKLDDEQQHHHDHPLLLTYDLTRRRLGELKQVSHVDHNHVTGPNLFENSSIEIQGGVAAGNDDDDDDSNFPTINCHCNICGCTIGKSGVYFCGNCPYYAHVKCVNDPVLKIKIVPVSIQYADIPNLVNFPAADEGDSVATNILLNTDVAYFGGRDKLHEHELNMNCDDEDDVLWRVCNACVGLIDTNSECFFYCAGGCTDFFLHDWCENIPREFIKHRAHRQHPLFLSPKATSPEFSDLIYPKFRCKCCSRACNGFAYSCREKECADFHLDVVCALMPSTTTYESHGSSTHILYLSPRSRNVNLPPESSCICCYSRDRDLYECRTCSNFRICVSCILLPDTVRHRFDRHPLSLKTASFDELKRLSDHFCEICEQDIIGDTSTDDHVDRKWCWYYGCDECDQSFHINCIPRLGSLSKIKLGMSVRVPCHDSCPMKLVRAFTVAGYRCGRCRNAIRPEDELAFECSKCYYRIHEKCAVKE